MKVRLHPALAALTLHAVDQIEKLICAGTIAFWDTCHKGNAEAKKCLLDGGYGKLLGEQATFERKSPQASPR